MLSTATKSSTPSPKLFGITGAAHLRNLPRAPAKRTEGYYLCFSALSCFQPRAQTFLKATLISVESWGGRQSTVRFRIDVLRQRRRRNKMSDFIALQYHRRRGVSEYGHANLLDSSARRNPAGGFRLAGLPGHRRV